MASASNNTNTRTLWFERYGYEYKFYYTHAGDIDVSLFVDADGFSAITFFAGSEYEAHRRVIEEITAFERCGF